MYEYLSGTISELAPTHAVLDVGGVGYFLQISLQTYSEIEHSDRVKLFVHYVVREDAQLLYGFASKAERELFRHLISVSGVGGNTARMILSTYSPRELQGIIATENAVLLKNVKGLGLKTAQKIIVELSGKMAGLGLTGEGQDSWQCLPWLFCFPKTEQLRKRTFLSLRMIPIRVPLLLNFVLCGEMKTPGSHRMRLQTSVMNGTSLATQLSMIFS